MEIKSLLLSTFFVAIMMPFSVWAEDTNTTSSNSSVSTIPFDKNTIENGHAYRIPSLVRVDKNTLIAFSDYRIQSGVDVGGTDGHTSIIAKKSTDNGKTWEKAVTILDANVYASEPNFKYGDAATVFDPSSKKILLMCCGGTVAYGKGKVKVYTALVDPDNLQTVTPNEITDKIYNLFSSNSKITSLFPTSGDMCMSKIIKKGNVNRIYCALVTTDGVRVIYTDEIPLNDLSTIQWNVLGDANTDFMYHANKYYSDESKCVELPDGSVWVTSRYKLDGRSRGFNVFNYTDDTYASGSWGASNSVNCEASPDKSNNNFRMSSSRTNAGIVLIPAKRVSDGAHVYVVCHSIPYGIKQGNTWSDRRVLGINWKVLKDRNDFTTMDGDDVLFKNQTVNGSHKLLTGWNNYQIDGDNDYAAYSTLLDNQSDGVDLLYEYTQTEGDYSIVYKSIPLSTITDGKYTYDGSLSRTAYMNVNVKPVPGNVYLIKARLTNPDGTIKEGYLHSNFSVTTKDNVTANDNASLTASQPNEETSPDPTYFWAYSKDGENEDPYFSSFNGDGYMGWGKGGQDYYNTGSSLKPNTVMCTPFYLNAFAVKSFTHKAKNYASTTSVTAEDLDGYALDFYHTSYGQNRFLSVRGDGEEVNWMQNTLKYFKNPKTKTEWTTDLIFIKVEPDNTEGYGSFNAPTFNNTGFPITFARSEDDCDAYKKSKDQKNFDFNYYATLRVPFAVYVPDGVTVYKLTSSQVVKDNEAVALTEYTDLPTESGKKVIPRETPVIMKIAGSRGQGNTSVVKYFTLAPGQNFDKTLDSDGNNNTTHLSGTLGREVLSSDFYTSMEKGTGSYLYYVLGKVNGYVALYKLKKNKNDEFAIAKNKAYYKYNLSNNSSSAKGSLYFDYDGASTGIISVDADGKVFNNGKVYDLNGRYVGTSLDNLAPGLYIQNGHKVVKQ